MQQAKKGVGAVNDPALLEVLRNALEGIADGMAVTLVRTSRSSVVRTGFDFSTAVLAPNGELIGQGLCQPIHMGGMTPALNACRIHFKDNINPEDVLVTNDPYEGGSHLPDLFAFKPVFVGDVLIGFSCAMSHHTDMGGRVAGSNASDSTEIYQEGLRIPPLKLYDQGKRNETLCRILEKAVRVPEQVLGDLEGQLSALRYGERELLRLAETHGAEYLLSLQHQLLDQTEHLTRRAIRAMPEGEWRFTDYIDNDGLDDKPIAIVVKVSKRDDELTIDFTGTSPQCKGAINCVGATTYSMVYAVVRTVLAENVPNTGGYFRPVNIIAPEGTIVCAKHPAAVAARALTCFRITHALFGAFAQVLPQNSSACNGGCEYIGAIAGYNKDHDRWRAWVQVDGLVEVATGAFYDRDGLDGQGGPVCNIANIPAEEMEIEHPVRIEEYSYLPDSEGAGEFRGGIGVVRQYRYLQNDTVMQVRGDRQKNPPFGLFGGQASRPTRMVFNKDTSEERVIPPKSLMTMMKGDSLRVENPGGGGWGNPWKRDPQKVLQDVIDELITPDRARDVYGVVLNLDRREVNLQATREMRTVDGIL